MEKYGRYHFSQVNITNIGNHGPPDKLISNNMEITDEFKLKDILKTDTYFTKLSDSRKIKMNEELFKVKETKEVWQLNVKVIWDWVLEQEKNIAIKDIRKIGGMWIRVMD